MIPKKGNAIRHLRLLLGLYIKIATIVPPLFRPYY
jgi:hypothetical protein